ncbi:MAG: glycosyltransferase, partial [Cyanobium sp.]
LNLSTPLAAAISLTALAAEMLLLASGSLELLFSLWLPIPAVGPANRSPAVGSAQKQDGDLHEPIPSVEVLIPSCGEPPALLESCLRACLDLDYPAFRIWLLDDSGRPELSTLCSRLGVRYLARQQRLHAKAGNLNHALPQLQGELIAVFDADVMPLRSFLRHTAPLFRDPDLGFVQTPQTYRNADPVMRNLGLERWLMPDEESFYRWIEPCRDGLGAVVCAGTSFVVRREALERVGGFETDTPSEDLATGIRITAAGYRNRYLRRKLSSGLAPLTAAAMARQRCRWASGTLQLIRTGANPLTIAGLNPLQRGAYLEGIIHWLMPVPQLLLALMPLSLGVLGVAPLTLTGEGLLLHALPFALAQLMLIRWLSAQSRTALLPELYRWIFLVPLAGTVMLTLLGRPQRFRVTPKALATDGPTGPAGLLLLPLLALIGLQLFGLLNLLRPSMAATLSALSTATLTLNLVWAALNLLLLGLAVRACLEREGLSEQPWFALQLPCRLQGEGFTVRARLEAISEAGVELRLLELPSCPADPEVWHRIGSLPPLERPARIAAPPGPEPAAPDGRRAGPSGVSRPPSLSQPQPPSPGPSQDLVLELNGGDPEPGPLPIRPLLRNGRRLGAQWGDLSSGQRRNLLRFLHGREGVWPERNAAPEPLALAVVLQRLMLGCEPETWFRRSLMPQAAPGTVGAREPPHRPGPAVG